MGRAVEARRDVAEQVNGDTGTMAATTRLSSELTAVQLGVWYAQQLAPDSPAYNTGGYLDIHGPLDAGLLLAAIRKGLEESDASRLRFKVAEDGTPRQYAGDAADHAVRTVDLSSLSDPHAAAQEWMRADLNRARDLTGEPLSSHAVLKLGPEHHLWYLCSHHAVLDGGSNALFAARVADIYSEREQGRAGESAALESVSVLMESALEYQTSPDRERDREYWLGLLADRPEADAEALPGTAPGEGADVGVSGGPQVRARLTAAVRHITEIEPADAGGLREAARRHRVSFAAMAIAAGAVYHHLLTGSQDVVVGVSVNGRLRRAEVGIPGITANVMPVRLAVTPGQTVNELLRSASHAVRAALPHQRYQYADIIRDLKLVGSGALCDLIVNVTPVADPIQFGACTGRITGLSSGPAESLKLEMYNRLPDAGLQLAVDVNRDVHGIDGGARISRRYLRVLQWLAAADPDARVGSVDLLEGAERRRVLVEWNDTAVEVGVSSVVELFAGQVARVPDAVAVVFGDDELTYQDLDARANRLAWVLRDAGVGAESVVALCLPRGVEMIAAILAVWKAGAAYLPIDPGFPVDRVSFMLGDSRAAVLVGARDVLDELPVRRMRMVALDDARTVAALAAASDADPGVRVLPGQVAYVVYTSGSTGVPKGVAVTHGGLANYVASVPQRVGFGAGRYVLLQAQVTDLGNTVVFGSLASGGTLHVLGADDAVDAAAVADMMGSQSIDFVKAVPSHLAAFSSMRVRSLCYRGVRWCWVARLLILRGFVSWCRLLGCVGLRCSITTVRPRRPWVSPLSGWMLRCCRLVGFRWGLRWRIRGCSCWMVGCGRCRWVWRGSCMSRVCSWRGGMWVVAG